MPDDVLDLARQFDQRDYDADPLANLAQSYDQQWRPTRGEITARIAQSRAELERPERADQLAGLEAHERFLRDMPFVSGLTGASRNISLDRARRRIEAGREEPGDYASLAFEARRQDRIREDTSTAGGTVLHALESALPIAGEAMLPGGIFARGGTAAGGAVARSLGARVAQGAATVAAQTARTPSLYLEQATAHNVAEGRDPMDPRGAGSAFAMGAIQTAILGRMNPLADIARPGTGVVNAAIRGGISTGSTLIEQQLADLGTSYLSELTGVKGLDTGYGTIPSIVRGYQNGDPDEAYRHALGQAVAFTAFAALHQVQRPNTIADTFADSSRAMARHGMARNEVGRRLGAIGDMVQAARDQGETAGQAPSQADLLRGFAGPERRYAEALVENLPPVRPYTAAELGSREGRDATLDQIRTQPQEQQGATPETPARPPESPVRPATPEQAPTVEKPAPKPAAGQPEGRIDPLAGLGEGIRERVLARAKEYNVDVADPKNRSLVEGWVESAGGRRPQAPAPQAPPEVKAPFSHLDKTELAALVKSLFPKEKIKTSKELVERMLQAGFPEPTIWQMSEAHEASLPAAKPSTDPLEGLTAVQRATVLDMAKATGLNPHHPSSEATLRQFADAVAGRAPTEAPAPAKPKLTPMERLARGGKQGGLIEPTPPADVKKPFSPGVHEGRKTPPTFREVVEAHTADNMDALNDLFSRAGLDPFERETVVRRLGDETFKAIAGDRYSAVRMKQFEQSGMKKLGENRSIDEAYHGPRREAGRAQAAEDAKAADLVAKGYEPRRARYIALEDTLQSRIDKINDAYFKESKGGKLSPEREQHWKDELLAAFAALEKARAAETARLAPEQGPAQRSGGRTDLPAREGNEGPVSQSAENQTPAPGGDAPSRRVLTHEQASRRGRKAAKAAEDYARSIGLDVELLHQVADAIAETTKTENAENDAGHNAVIDEIRAHVEQATNNKYALRDAISKATRGKGDAKNVPALDTAVQALSGEARDYLKSRDEGGARHLPDVALEVLQEGKRTGPTDEYIYTEASRRLEESRLTKEERDGFIEEAKKAGYSAAETERLIREIESDGLTTGTRQSLSDYLTQSTTSGESDVGDFGYGANEPGFGRPPSDAEYGAGSIGGGQSNADGAGRPLRETALAFRRIDEERAQLGLPPILGPAVKGDPLVWMKVMSQVQRDPQAAPNLLKELAKKPRQTSDEETALLLQHRVALQNEHMRTMLEILEAQKPHLHTPQETLAPMYARERLLQEQLTAFEEVVRKAGTEWGRAGRWRRMLAAEDFTLAGMLTQKAIAKQKPLSEEEHATIVALQARIAELEAIRSKETTRTSDAGFDLDRIKVQWLRDLEADRQAHQAWPQRTLRLAGELVNVPRSLMSMIDFPLLRQGALAALSHPIRTAKGVPDMFRAFGSKDFADRAQYERENRPNALFAQLSGLKFDRAADPILQQEGGFFSRVIDAIPGLGHVRRASERGYREAVNRIRADAFDAMTASLAQGGKLSVEEGRVAANYVNVMTGYGKLPESWAGAAGLLGQVFYSPRWALSRFQMLLGQPLWMEATTAGTGRARVEVAKEYARIAAGLGVGVGLALAAGFSIEKDPRSTDFAKLRMGNTRLDMTGNLASTADFLTRIFAGEKVNQNGVVQATRGQVAFGRDDTASLVGRYLRGKLSPFPGAALDVASGRNLVGDPVTPLSALGNISTPLFVKDVYQALVDLGIGKGTALSLMAFLGMSMNTYTTRAPQGRVSPR